MQNKKGDKNNALNKLKNNNNNNALKKSLERGENKNPHNYAGDRGEKSTQWTQPYSTNA